MPVGGIKYVTAAVTAQNQFTGWVTVAGRPGKPSTFTASVADDAATLAATLSVEARRVNADGTFGNPTLIEAVAFAAGTLGTLKTYSLVGLWQVRCGVRTGGYTAGTGVMTIHY